MNEVFYTVRDRIEEEGSHKVRVNLNTEHSVYAGHFKDQPIAPGVMLMNMCREVAGVVLNREVRIKTARSIKFRKIVDPRKIDCLELNMKFTDIAEGQRMVCTAELEGAIYFKIIATI